MRASARRPHHDAETGFWLVPLPTIDPLVVARSAAALPRYGPDFTYGHYAAVRRLTSVVAGLGAVAAVGAAAQVGPLRRQVLRRVPQGEGPSEERRARSRFTVRFVAEGGDRTVHTEVSGGDPGYTETAKMLAESALCLAFDDNPVTLGPGHDRSRDGPEPAGPAGRRRDGLPGDRHDPRVSRVTCPFGPFRAVRVTPPRVSA